MLKRIASSVKRHFKNAGGAEFPSLSAGRNLRYKVEGYAQTRDAAIWIASSAPDFAYGLSLDEVFMALEHGYQSVLGKVTDPERATQWAESHEKMRSAYFLFAEGNIFEGKRLLNQAAEAFTLLRRIGGKAVSRQELGDTEHGANEMDE